MLMRRDLTRMRLDDFSRHADSGRINAARNDSRRIVRELAVLIALIIAETRSRRVPIQDVTGSGRHPLYSFQNIEPRDTRDSKKKSRTVPRITHRVTDRLTASGGARNYRAVTRRTPAKRYDSLARPCSFNGKTPGGRTLREARGGGGGQDGGRRCRRWGSPWLWSAWEKEDQRIV